MKNKKEKKAKQSNKHRYDKGEIFVKVMAGILVLLMMAGTLVSIVFALI